MNEGDDKTHLSPGDLLITNGVYRISMNTGMITIAGKDGLISTSISGAYMRFQGTNRSVFVTDLGVEIRNGKSSTILGADSDGGLVYVTDENGTIVSKMGVGEKGGGLIQLRDQHEKSAIQLSFDDSGGDIVLFNKGGENVLQASVGYRGGGVIHTRDKHGYRTGHLP